MTLRGVCNIMLCNCRMERPSRSVTLNRIQLKEEEKTTSFVLIITRPLLIFSLLQNLGHLLLMKGQASSGSDWKESMRRKRK